MGAPQTTANGAATCPPDTKGETLSTSPDATAIRRREHLFRLSQATTDASIIKVSDTKYQVAYRIQGQQWARFDFLASSAMGSPPPGGHSLLQLNQSAVDLPWLSVDHTDASVTLSATGWSGNTANANSYGGSYNQNNATVGSYVEWVAPVGAVRVGTRTVAAVNEGIHLVTIDGDRTRANLLPTAQQLVTAGKLPAAALVANGGTFNPTDRVIDQFSGASSPTSVIDYDRHFALADGLDPATAHTVRITMSGYKNVLASDIRLYTSGFTYGRTDTTHTTAGAQLLPATRVLSEYDSAYEYAHDYTPPGVSSYVFVGSVHGYEKPATFRVYVDNEEVTLTNGERRYGAITVVRTSELYHPSATTTKQADITTVYRLGAAGLTIEHETVWAVSGGKMKRSYPAMFPVNGGSFTKGSMTYAATDYDLSANAGAYIGRVKSDTVYMWEPAGTIGALVHIPDLEKSVQNWADNAAIIYASIEDRAPDTVNTGNLSKAYITRQGEGGPTVTITAGDVWKSSAVYRIWRSVNINSALAR